MRPSALDRGTSGGELLLHFHALLQSFFQRRGECLQWRFAFRELTRQFVAPLLQLFELIAQAFEARRNGLQSRALRLDLDRHFLRAVAIGLRLRALERQVLAQLLALMLQVDARGFEFRHRIHAFLQACTRFRNSAGATLIVALQLFSLRADAAHAFGGLLGLRPQRARLRVRVAGDTMQPVDLFLVHVATLLVLRQLRARIGEVRLRLVPLTLGVGDDVAQRAHLFLAADDAGMHVFVAADTQPLAPDPDTVARNDRLAAQQRAPLVERLGQCVDGDDAGQQRRDRSWTLHTRQQPAGVDLLRTGAASREERNRADLQRFEPARDRVDRIDGNCFEVRAEHGLDCALPALLDDELLSQARTLDQRIRAQPLSYLALRQTERGLLQSLQRHQAPLRVLQLLATAIVRGDELALALTQPLHFLGGLAQLIGCALAGNANLLLLGLQRREASVDFRRAQLRELALQALTLRDQTGQLVYQLLDARALDLRLFAGRPRVAIEFFPALLPVLHRLFGLSQRCG
jgi:hypothetical protein